MAQACQEVAEPYGQEQEEAAGQHPLRVAEEAVIPLGRELGETYDGRRDQDAESPDRYTPGRVLR
jgi:hypothetical protein